MTFIMPVGVSNLGDVPQRNPGRKKLRPLAFFFYHEKHRNWHFSGWDLDRVLRMKHPMMGWGVTSVLAWLLKWWVGLLGLNDFDLLKESPPNIPGKNTPSPQALTMISPSDRICKACGAKDKRISSWQPRTISPRILRKNTVLSSKKNDGFIGLGSKMMSMGFEVEIYGVYHAVMVHNDTYIGDMITNSWGWLIIGFTQRTQLWSILIQHHQT